MIADAGANGGGVTAESFCNSVRDGTHDSPKFLDSGHPLVTSKNIKDGRVVLETANFISEQDFNDINRRSKVDQWDVLFSMIGTVGEVCLVRDEEPVFAIKNVGLFKTGNELKGKWLYYWLRSPAAQGAIQKARRGASQQYMPLGALRKFPVPVPANPLVMQNVVELVSAYDDLIDNNRRRIALLEEAVRLLYREWFVNFRFPGHEHVKITDGLPDGWMRPMASSVMDVLSGGTPKTGNSAFWDGDIGFFTPKDATDTPYVQSTEKTITEEGLRACNSKLYPADTLFITARGTVGKLNLALVPMAMNQSCYALKAKSYFGQRYLYVSLKAAIEQVRARATGAVFDAIIVATFDRIPFLLPPETLTRIFEQSIDPMFEQIANLIQQNQKLAQARDLLLPRLMNGEIAV